METSLRYSLTYKLPPSEFESIELAATRHAYQQASDLLQKHDC
jgi:hypothetical protein